jgi:flagellar motor switch/type III secretory pathway protein FliN
MLPASSNRTRRRHSASTRVRPASDEKGVLAPAGSLLNVIIDQGEIDALLHGRGTAASAPQRPGPGPQPEAPNPAPPPRPRSLSAEVRRLLRIRVPAIVELVRRRIRIAEVRRFSLGMIIEFSKNVDENLTLRINNHTIGHGVVVKTGEKFGMRIEQIIDRAARIRSLGE